MALDHELPVWGVRPNWSQSIIETLTWQTDVLQSQSGAEQRVSQRIAPRRMFEARYNPHEHERTFVDLAMHRLGRNEWMMPLWFDRAPLTASAVAGASRVALNTAHHEFSAGGMAYLVGPDTFTGEAVRIESIDATGLNLVVPLSRAWGAGTSVHPMRRGWFEESSHVLLTSRLGDSNIRFHVIEGNDLADEGTWATLHEGTPVLLEQPDWSRSIEIDLSFLGDEFDSLTGKKRVTDTAGRSFRQQQHSFFLSGAAHQFAFRQMLYRLRGQQKSLWLPTFGDDIEIASPAISGATTIDIKQVGLSYVGGPADGRDRLVFSDGQVVEVTDSSIIGGTNRERLTLATGLTSAKLAGTRASFIEKVRLAQDSVEIEHVGDIDGFARSTLSFRAFADRRITTVAAQPIPAAAMSDTSCGTPAIDSPCTFIPVFTGWYARARVDLVNPTTTIPPMYIVPQFGVAIFHVAGGTFYPNGVPRAVYDEDGFGITMYWIEPEVVDGVEAQLRMQFPNGSVGELMRAKFSFQKWNESSAGSWTGGSSPKAVSTVFDPGTPSFSLGNPFDVQGLDDWFFAI